ncbi:MULTISPECIES: glycosyltransferase [Psychrilyobacter]|uniref:Glycosyltransferase n=1 Tax=Psychrilyobacter piezotolerans TaxID=2293438 RepID=A0ABX9KES8_9FUSO|nr:MULTISPECIES: glycosyltransferase [Psychrilyobacter]MCS5422122.1 glycosyltransferase [Psychrilyobacter sp. S5]NDI76281.1 glycosyltransferase family 4 protein [Psychrilyobacter piezotolerans]RDE59166.1 glycosyltransferase [Psychrilyobacter sp. S5]REI39728.1 glycosyltransferase [Psychrilyobacter piezotolerans]
MKKEVYPKILVVNLQSIFKNNATGITLRNILKSWPKDKLMEIHILPEEGKKLHKFKGTKTVCTPKITFPLRALSNMAIFKKTNSGLKKDQETSNTKVIRSGASRKESLRQCLCLATDLSSMYISNSLKEAVDNFNPDVIYTLGGSVSVMKLSQYFSKRQNINIVMHSMDNWQETLQWNNNRFLKPYKAILDCWVKKTYKSSVRALAISPKMAEVYSQRWNIPHYMIMNSVDVNSMFCETKVSSEIFSFVYAGGLHLERWKSLKDISEAIEIVSTKLNKKIILKIYTGKQNKDHYKKHFNPNFVQFYDFVPNEEIKSVFDKADVLLHTEQDNSQLYGFFKYSISTKIPEYLSSNRPVLFYGPRKLYLYKYLENEQAAYTAFNKDELILAVERFVQDNKLKNNLVKNGRMLAMKNHDTKDTDKIFYKSIVESVKKNY